MMMMNVKIYGEKVRAAREGAYLSKGELAAKANLNRNTIGRIENADVSDVHPRTIRKIAEALSVDPAFIASKE
jgi:transcriptional regulator with XRE-family HTH domain